ncbi:MAG: PIN domain-containing protein [Acidobacteriota bacterium]
MKVFVDSGYYLARMMPHDQWHRAALRAVAPGMKFFTSSLVVNETITLLQRRGFFSAALEFLRQMRATGDVETIYPDVSLQSDAWDQFERWGGSGANAVDCVSFAIMKRYGIRKAFTFDTHFKEPGFEILKP